MIAKSGLEKNVSLRRQVFLSKIISMGLLNKLFGGRQEQPLSLEKLLEDVEVLPGLVLPRVFLDHQTGLAEAKRSYISITAIPAETLTLRQSKFYHYPCLPNGFPYPTDKKGNYLIPLAQINLSECPSLNGFPNSGFLQFYIADDELYGLNFDDQKTQIGFRVLYFKEEELTKPIQDFSFLDGVMHAEYSPVNKPYRLSFQLREEYLAMGDYHGRKIIDAICEQIAQQYPQMKDKISDILYDRASNTGHRLGGYAYFTQEDPRVYKKEWRDRILLFQLDSDNDIMWGDVGVANFFIQPDKLARLDFSDIVYNWDCC
jgi:uncharacterized protein YwqG